MKNPGLPDPLWLLLDGNLWHATDVAGLAGIFSDGSIKVSEAERYRNSYCRCQESVSLFDFGPLSSDQPENLFSNWYGWFSNQHSSRCVIWLRIYRDAVAERLIDPSAVRKSCPNNQRYFGGVEACHKGPIAVSAINGAIVIDGRDINRIQFCKGPIDRLIDNVIEFHERLPPPPPEHPLVLALKRQRLRNGIERE